MSSIVLGSNHFEYLWFGERWEAVGDALRVAAPGFAALAYDHAQAHYEAYDREWSAHLPASRFDADGGAYLMPLRAKQEAVMAAGTHGPATTWVHALCRQRAEDAIARYDRAPGEDVDGMDEAGRLAAHALLAAHATRAGLTEAAARHQALAQPKA